MQNNYFYLVEIIISKLLASIEQYRCNSSTVP
ncbi:MAG: hypothetical protein ACI9N1_002905, partial [Flavobacteriales bacterium]